MQDYPFYLMTITPHITGSKKQSEGRAALFAVRVHVIVIFQYHPAYAFAPRGWLFEFYPDDQMPIQLLNKQVARPMRHRL